MSAVPIAQAAQRNRGAGRRVLAGGAVLVLVVATLAVLLTVGVDYGPVALATGLLLATVPVPLYVSIALRVDRFEPEPLRLLASSFFWGASGATFIALILNSAGHVVVGSSLGPGAGRLYAFSISAPVVEETAKAAVLFAIYRWRRSEFDGVLDGIVYAAMVGLGFAMTENVLYYGRAEAAGGVPLAVTFFLRGVIEPFAHPVFTAMTGIGLGVAAQSSRPATRVLAPAGGLLAAMLLHSLSNTSTLGGGAGYFGVFLLVMVPIFVALIVMVVVTLRREARIIGAQLAPEVATGVLRPGDLLVLTSLHDRQRLRRAARRDGRRARRAARQWMETATELAFLRHRLQRGLNTGSASPRADEAALAARLRELRPAIGSAADAVAAAAAGRAGPAGTDPAVGLPATAWQPWTPERAPAPTPAIAPAGWYPDPWAQARWRWWDGREWTGHAAG
ncbi:MAG: PrsW family glutamic-type intramembrane protease [Solirubrobacteraceae bacterium]